jgi:hypothetical protein
MLQDQDDKVVSPGSVAPAETDAEGGAACAEGMSWSAEGMSGSAEGGAGPASSRARDARPASSVAPAGVFPLAGEREGKAPGGRASRDSTGRRRRQGRLCGACACLAVVVALGLAAFFLYPRIPDVSAGPDAFKNLALRPENCAVGDPSQLAQVLSDPSRAAKFAECALDVNGTVAVTVRNPNFVSLDISDLSLSIVYSSGGGDALVVSASRAAVATLAGRGATVVSVNIGSRFEAKAAVGIATSVSALLAACESAGQVAVQLTGQVQVRHPLYSGPISLSAEGVMLPCAGAGATAAAALATARDAVLAAAARAQAEAAAAAAAAMAAAEAAAAKAKADAEKAAADAGGSLGGGLGGTVGGVVGGIGGAIGGLFGLRM